MPFLVPRALRARIFFSAAAALLILPLSAQAQRTEPPPMPGIPSAGANDAASPSDPGMRRMTEAMAVKRNNLRQQQIVSDTAHLLELAQKLNDQVSKSSKNELSVSVVKEADEIEKLAKSIKEKMRDGT